MAFLVSLSSRCSVDLRSWCCLCMLIMQFNHQLLYRKFINQMYVFSSLVDRKISNDYESLYLSQCQLGELILTCDIEIQACAIHTSYENIWVGWCLVITALVICVKVIHTMVLFIPQVFLRWFCFDLREGSLVCLGIPVVSHFSSTLTSGRLFSGGLVVLWLIVFSYFL